MISLSDNDAWRCLRLTPLLSSSRFPAFLHQNVCKTRLYILSHIAFRMKPTENKVHSIFGVIQAGVYRGGWRLDVHIMNV